MLVKELPEKKTGHLLSLGNELDKQVQAYLSSFQENRTVINTVIAMVCAQGFVKSYNSNLLECKGEHISLNKNWVKHLMEEVCLEVSNYKS